MVSTSLTLSRLYFSLLGQGLVAYQESAAILLDGIAHFLMQVGAIGLAGEDGERLRHAGAVSAADAANSGDKAAAEAAYLALAADVSLGMVYRDAALILSVMNAAEGTSQ